MTEFTAFATTRILAATICAVVLTAEPLLAQTVVGMSAVDGRKVELLDNGTWRYVSDGARVNACKSLPLKVSFCGVSQGWTETMAPSADVAAQFRFDDRNYGQFVIEGLGLDDGMSEGLMLDAVLSNAAAATGVNNTDIPVLDLRDATVAGHNGKSIVYQVDFDGLNVVFVNTIVVLPKRSIQSMTFSFGTKETDESRALHAQFLDQTRIDE